ncbi:MAG TPA: hypothetical protein DHV07_06735 [Flavobacteriales bacterium]|jgi:tRNA U34 5-methylaminomethyl-2-thiouridine-forming methyltransferase MnmC/8-oxo-dGTP pyrophosphatase MutT (NUDIX family)|nr:hypothetical protein [Flavobacteriales bacterium]
MATEEGPTPMNSEREELTAQRTADGSFTLHSLRFNQAYHSRHGAVTESLHVFLHAGFNHCIDGQTAPKPLRILELGLGTGLNALLTYSAWNAVPAARRPALEYVALEPHPLSSETLTEMALATDAGVSDAHVNALHDRHGAERHQVQWEDGARFVRLLQGWQEFAASETGTFDLIYYDAFAPDSQPELWAEERFKEAHELLNIGGMLVTYCSKGAVRRAMQSAGLVVEKLPGPPGKREMLRATRPDAENVPLKRFNVRVYFFLMDGTTRGDVMGDRVLVSDEIIAGRRFTKWPGGGLEFGEGPGDCARREALEELGQPISLGPLVHATASFVRSAWRPDEQVLCHYYVARLDAAPTFRVTQELFDFEAGAKQSFRWVNLEKFEEGALSFATDREAWRAFTASNKVR